MTVTIAPNPVDAALVARLAADTDPTDGFVALVPGGAWHLAAPEDVADPYCVFGLMIPSDDTYTLGGLAFSRLTYGFDIIQEGLSAERASTGARRLNFLLTDQEANLPMTGWVFMACRRVGYAERLERTDGGVLYQHIQSIFSVTVRPA